MISLQQKPLITLRNKPAFGDSSQRFLGMNLDTVGQMGADPGLANLTSTLGVLAARPAITMMDKETPFKARVYSATWQAGMSLMNVPIQLGFYSKIQAFSDFIGQKITGVKLDKNYLGLTKNAALLEAVVKQSTKGPQVEDIIKMSAEEAVKLANQIDDKIAKGGKKALQEMGESIFHKSPSLIVEVNKNKEKVSQLLKNKDLAQKALSVSGISKLLSCILLLGAFNAGTMVVTKYLDPAMKFIGNKFNIDAFKQSGSPEGAHGHGGCEKTAEKIEQSDEKTKKKFDNFDKIVLPVVGGLAGLLALNAAGKVLKKGPVGDQIVSKLYKTLDSKLQIGKTANKIFDPLFKKIGQFENRAHKLAGLANVNDKWVEVNVIGNLALRSLITLPTVNTVKGRYNMTRLVVDEVLNLGFLGAADKYAVRPLSRQMAKAAKVPAYNEGIKVISDQFIKSFMIVSVAMGFANNAVSGRAIKFLDKILNKDKKDEIKPEELEENYQDFKKQSIYAGSIKTGNNIKSVDSASRLARDESLLPLIKNEIIFSDFLKAMPQGTT